jgi:hypothetical protein
MKLLAVLLAATATLASATPAAAVALKFDITGDYTASFLLDSSPTPDFVADDFLFAITQVRGFPNSADGFADISFFRGQFGGLLVSKDNNGFVDYLLDAVGPQLYSGTEAAPTFAAGIYQLEGLSTPGQFTLTISAVPEPSTWGMAIVGFGIAGTALRRRRAKVRVSYT